MRRPILLDTCALLWVANKESLREEAMEALEDAGHAPDGIVVSPISAWEIGQLAARGRIGLPIEPATWFQVVLDSGVGLAPMPPSVLIGSSFLPGEALRDPADRIIAATARAFGYSLMTRHQPLLSLAEQGHLHALRC